MKKGKTENRSVYLGKNFKKLSTNAYFGIRKQAVTLAPTHLQSQIDNAANHQLLLLFNFFKLQDAFLRVWRRYIYNKEYDMSPGGFLHNRTLVARIQDKASFPYVIQWYSTGKRVCSFIPNCYYRVSTNF